MAMAQLVYPGAVHTRLHHALGAYHLMGCALQELSSKGIEITEEEKFSAKAAILLHDIGHGPFSHALEHVLAESFHHEELSLMLMKSLNEELNGELNMALDIFCDKYHKKFLHQLISGQLDVDRMDYLTRDSFYTGVNEGVIGYDRIIKMLTVHNGALMVEEKGIYSIEKFLVARRLMYWQAYLHKTVVSAEQMLQRIIKRAKHIHATCAEPLNTFINKEATEFTLEKFCNMDDTDVMMAIKNWCNHTDPILSALCKGIINRSLFKLKFRNTPFEQAELEEKQKEMAGKMGLSVDDASWLAFVGEASSSTYNFEDERIQILFKDGTVKDISAVDNALIHENLRGKVKKYYICHHR
jgi:HD superfamily phosphohydrolase